MPKKKVYDNLYRISCKPKSVYDELVKVGRILEKISADEIDIEIRTKAFDRTVWLTQRRLTIIGVAIGVVAIVISILLKIV